MAEILDRLNAVTTALKKDYDRVSDTSQLQISQSNVSTHLDIAAARHGYPARRQGQSNRRCRAILIDAQDLNHQGGKMSLQSSVLTCGATCLCSRVVKLFARTTIVTFVTIEQEIALNYQRLCSVANPASLCMIFCVIKLEDQVYRPRT